MKLEESSIYPFIKRYPETHKLRKYRAGDVIISAVDPCECVWFLISGKIRVEAVASNGKGILVDELEPDNYVGHLSNFFGQNFYCNSTAVVSSTLISIPVELFKKLLNEDIRFNRHFYIKVNNRLYTMYKKDMVHHLYSQKQQFAYYLLQNQHNNICYISNIVGICGQLDVSRRNFYNLIDKFIDLGIIERMECGDLYISDMDLLMEEAGPVDSFLNNRM